MQRLALSAWRPIWLTATAVVLPGVAVAADDAEQASGGMPQLDPSTFVSQLVWLAIAFAVLYYVLNKKLLPSITEIRAARQAKIDEDLGEAQKLREQAEAALAQYEEVVAQAHDKANGAIKAAQDKLHAEFAERQARIDAEMSAKLADAHQRIDKARQAALEDVNGVAVEAARAATSKLIGVELDISDVERAVSQARQEVA